MLGSQFGASSLSSRPKSGSGGISALLFCFSNVSKGCHLGAAVTNLGFAVIMGASSPARLPLAATFWVVKATVSITQGQNV